MADDELETKKIKTLREQLDEHRKAKEEIPKAAQWFGTAGTFLAISTLFCLSAAVVGVGVAIGVQCYQIVMEVLGG